MRAITFLQKCGTTSGNLGRPRSKFGSFNFFYFIKIFVKKFENNL